MFGRGFSIRKTSGVLIDYLNVWPTDWKSARALAMCWVRASIHAATDRAGFVTVGQFLESKEPIIVRSCGIKFVIRPSSEDLGYVTRHHKAAVVRWFNPSPGEVVVDVGAHLGFFSAFAASRGAKVISIEPNPRTFRVLERNLILNRFVNAHAVNLAVSSQPGRMTLHVPARFSGLSSLAHSAVLISMRRDRSEEVEVAADRLDSILKKSGVSKVDWLLVDSEGWEVEVLKSAGRSLRQVDRLVLEVSHGDKASACEELIAVESDLRIIERVPQSEWNEYWLAKTARATTADSMKARVV